MGDIKSDLAKLILSHSPLEGVNQTVLEGTHCIKFLKVKKRAKQHWHASLCIVVQGSKEIVLGHEVYRFKNEPHYIATPLDLPVTSRIFSASEDEPMLCLKVGFDPVILNEVAAQIEKDFSPQNEDTSRALFFGKASDQMLEAALRLVKLLKSADDAKVLGPLVIKELYYHLLKGIDGAAIRQFVQSGSKMHKISKAIYRLNSDLKIEVDVANLAKSANMSRSAFFKQFKEVTAVSPIQYQKRLRLLEARRLMIEEGETAESSAFKVGYNSPSQFSREYSRLFGTSPARSVLKMKLAQQPLIAD